jgi:hypothetical protein
VRALESSATAEVHKGWNIHQMEQVSPGNCALNQDPAPPAHLLPELRPELLPAEEKKACDRGGGESHRARAQTAPLVLAPRDSAVFAMKRDAVPAPTPRHGCARAATSSCETFISLITASGRPATAAHAARQHGARQPDVY